ncbi:MAG TPA: AAA family ATPase [Candidatus Cybelea sp.]|nr:AAA family ATPase [Candidatus Cybelea sp.]
MHRTAPISRDYLAFLFWPDEEEGSARGRLRSTISDLLRVLPAPGSDFVGTNAEEVWWNSDVDLKLDIDAFTAAANDSTRLDEAADLYRGDFLPELYDEWLYGFRERFKSIYLTVLTRLVSERRKRGDLTGAIAIGRRILEADQWREDIVRRIISLRYESGDAAGAISEYRQFAVRLREELGVDPMPETVAVAERIVKGAAPDEQDDEAEAAVIAAIGERSRPLPFVGREREIERLSEAWSRATMRRGSVVFIGGEPGIGKSRLVREFMTSIEESGGRALFGATGFPEAFPYQSLVEALRGQMPLVTALDIGPTWFSVLASLLPEIGQRIDALPALPPIGADDQRLRLFEALTRAFVGLARVRPLLIVLEDLHWASQATFDALAFLVRRTSGSRILVLATFRDDEALPRHPLRQLQRDARIEGNASSLSVLPLDATAVERIVAESEASFTGALEEYATAMHRRSNGNPLFITQLLETPLADESVPATIASLVEARVGALSPETQTVAEVAALAGQRFSAEVVRDVTGYGDATVDRALDELLDRRLVQETAGRGILPYIFGHQLVQGAIARSVSAADAAVRRRRIARALERLYPERASELSSLLAGHYEAAGDVEQAARCYLAAARRSMSVGAPREARMECARGLALGATPRARADLLLESVAIESRGGDRASWNASITALERIGSELDDAQLDEATLLHRIEFASAIGDREMFDEAAKALHSSFPQEDTRRDAALHLAQAKLEFTLGRMPESAAAAEVALARCRAAGDETQMTEALCTLAQAEAYRGLLTSAEALFDEAAQVAERVGDPFLEQLALTSGWIVAYQHRAIARCQTMAARSLELAVNLGDRLHEAISHSRLAVAITASGTGYARAREHFDAAVPIYDEIGDVSGSAGCLLNRALLETRLGFFDRAVAATEKAVRLFASMQDERGRIAGLTNLIFLKACVGDVAGAHRGSQVAIDEARRCGFGLLEASALENLAYATGAAGEYVRAIALAEQSFEVRSRSESQVWSSKTLADVAIWHAALGNLPAARDAVRQLLSDEDAIVRATEWPAYGYWVAAQILRLDGAPAESKRALERANALMVTSALELETEDREQFLGIPWHVDIAAAVATDRWPEPPR